MNSHGYPPQVDQNCGNCRFWIQLRDGSDYGRCRRHAPRPMPDDAWGDWPEVFMRNWCGEWAPREER